MGLHAAVCRYMGMPKLFAPKVIVDNNLAKSFFFWSKWHIYLNLSQLGSFKSYNISIIKNETVKKLNFYLICKNDGSIFVLAKSGIWSS